jgi:hypothetical protein
MEKEEIIKEITSKVENVVNRYNKKLEELATIRHYFTWYVVPSAFLCAVLTVSMTKYDDYYITGVCLFIVYNILTVLYTIYHVGYSPIPSLPTSEARGNGPMEIYLYPEKAALWAIDHRDEGKFPHQDEGKFPSPIHLYLLPEYAPLLYEERYHKKGTLTDNQFITNSVLYLITQFKLKSLQT